MPCIFLLLVHWKRHCCNTRSSFNLLFCAMISLWQNRGKEELSLTRGRRANRFARSLNKGTVLCGSSWPGASSEGAMVSNGQGPEVIFPFSFCGVTFQGDDVFLNGAFREIGADFRTEKVEDKCRGKNSRNDDVSFGVWKCAFEILQRRTIRIRWFRRRRENTRQENVSYWILIKSCFYRNWRNKIYRGSRYRAEKLINAFF